MTAPTSRTMPTGPASSAPAPKRRAMAVDLPRVAGLVFNTPLMFDRHQLDTVLSLVGPRILDGFAGPMPAPAVEPTRSRFIGGGYMAGEGIAVLPIVRTLVRRGSWLDAACGMASYGMISDAVTEILSDGSVRGLMLELDTPGGEAGGVFDLAGYIRDASESSGKPVWAHANELMASAGYAIGSAAERIWLAQTAVVGSIGVVAAHVDVSGADERAGVRWTYIYAGDHKVEGNMHEPLGDDARARVQADVDHLMDMFVRLVSHNRGMAAAAVRATKADMYRGRLAVESGLADEVGTLDEALTDFANHVHGGGASVSYDDDEPEARRVPTKVAARQKGAATKPKTSTDRVHAAFARGLGGKRKETTR